MMLARAPLWTLPLTSTRLSLVVGLVAIGALATTCWGWSRVPGPRPARTAARVGMLLGCQLCAVALVLIGLNDYAFFYGSWSELLGSGQRGTAPPVLRTGPAAPGPVQGGSLQVLGPYQHRASQQPQRDGQLLRVRLAAERSGRSQDAIVYLPPEYFSPEYAHARFPAVEVLTGFPGRPENLIERLSAPGTLLAAERARRSGPMVLVLLRPSTALPRDTECTDVPGGPLAATFLTQDVPADVSAAFRVRALDWGAFGDSTGGYCAAKLALTHSLVFRAAASLSGYSNAVQDHTTGDLYGGSPLVRRSNDLAARLRDLPPPPTALLLATSRTERGPDGFATAERLAALARPPLVLDTLVQPRGGHNFATWRRELPAVFAWLSRRLAAGPAAAAVPGAARTSGSAH